MTTNDEAVYEAETRYWKARRQVALLTELANKRTADPVRLMADLEAAVLEERRASEAMLLSREMANLVR